MSNDDKIAPDVRVGQVWADNDPRCEGRKVRVDEVVDQGGGPYATCTVLTAVGGLPVDRPRRVRIRGDRFRPTSTGFRLVSEATS